LQFKNDIEKNKYYREYADNKFRFNKKSRYYHKYLNILIKEFTGNASSVIEIGCGTGETLNYINPKTGFGIEHNKYLIEKGRELYPRLQFINADIESDNSLEDLLKQNKKFDYIILSDLIGTLDDIQKVFEKMKLVSREGTKIIVTYYNYFWNPLIKVLEALKLKMRGGEKNWLYIDEIKNLLTLADFQVEKSGNAILIPGYIPLVSFLFNKYIAKLPLIRRFCLVGFVIGKSESRPEKVKAKDYKVSIIVPCRNEEGNIENIIERILPIGSHTEIIFVEGNSEDNTFNKIDESIKSHQEKDIKLFKQTGKGKADAVRLGFEKASGDILMIQDADMTVEPEDLIKFYNALKKGKGEFINGTRLVYQMDDKAMRRLNKFGNIFFGKMFTWILGQRITDTLCGTKVLFKKDYERIVKNRSYFGDFDPFGDFDLIFGAAKLKLKIIEIPVRYKNREYGTTNINRFRDGFLLLKMCFFAIRKIKFSKS
jgi:SAM-dependent methyltransferase